MVLLTWLCLLLTILGKSISTSVAQGSANCGSGRIHDLCKHKEEGYIRKRVRNSTAAKSVTIDQSILNIDNNIKNAANKTISQIYQDHNQRINKLNTAVVEPELSDSLEKSCDFIVPDSIKPRNDIWKDRETPEMDGVDTYLNNTKGCQYVPLRFYRESYFFPERSFNGTPIEAHFAVRTHENAHIMVWWEPHTPADYVIDVGVEKNSITKLIDHKNSSATIATQSTPGILSKDSYVRFYVKIDNDNLAFGIKCEKPIISHNISINRKNYVYMNIASYSVFGGKILHDCSADA